MAEPRTLNIGYPPFKLAFEVEAFANVDDLSVCGWCSAIVVDQDRHTRMHSCGCSGTFRLAYAASGGHEPGVCPLAKEDAPPAEPEETEMWTFAIRLPRGSAQQVVSAIETVPGVDIYRAYITGADPAREGCVDHMPIPYALCSACAPKNQEPRS